MDREIKYICYLQSKGSNRNRKRMNFFRTIPTIKELVYRESIRNSITMKHGHKEFFGYRMTNFLIKYVNNEYE